ncbi:MAG: hypothetical protein ABSC46_03790 [Candidatus Limnocylindrales bacterium]
MEYLFATTAQGQGAYVYYLAGETRILSFGAPGSGLGIWRFGVPIGS